MPPDESTKPTLGTLLARAVRLRCPACGESKLFRNAFAMRDPCPVCGRRFHRAPGYLLGSIYFNYGVTSLLVVVMYFACFFTETLTGRALLWTMAAFALLFPLWFFRYARSLWVAFDELFDPWPNEEERRKLANPAGG